jgi:hypothetical protein
MKRAGRYWLVEDFTDRRHKTDRIHQGLKGPLSNGALFLRKKQTTLVSQIVHYPGKNPDGMHEDELEVIAIACENLSKGYTGEISDNFFQMSEDHIPELEFHGGCP